MLVQTALPKDSRNMNGQKYSRQLAATLYPLVGLEGIRYRFRLLRVREPIPQDNLRPKRMQQWADRLWRQELRCPVYPSTRFGYPCVGYLAHPFLMWMILLLISSFVSST